jgi:hypothetical protein
VARNVYFDLTREFNAFEPVAVLASGQAVVYYRVAIMSKDGDWVVREAADACARVLEVLSGHGASYRPGAPLDVRWLAGGWSSHFEFADEQGRRVRCDFFSRPPRVPSQAVARMFQAGRDSLLVVDTESLVRMKQTQRAKDYAVIAELASRLPPDVEVELTTDPDRLLSLAPAHAARSRRGAVQAAAGGDRDAVVVALAREQDRLQRADRERLAAYADAAQRYLGEFVRLSPPARRLPSSHSTIVTLADRWLPTTVDLPEDAHADPQ